MEDVEVEEVKWLIYPFIPYGKITIIQGDPGEGKTTLVLQIIARLTKGESIVNEEAKEPINVIYQTAEDGLADTIKPRLLSADADCSKVLVIDDKDTPLTMRDVAKSLEKHRIMVYNRVCRSNPMLKARFLNGVHTGGYAPHFYIHRQKCRVYERGYAYEK